MIICCCDRWWLLLKLKVVVNGQDRKKETIFFEEDRLNAIDADSKLVIQKWVEHKRITVAVFNHWRYYEVIDDDSRIDPLQVMWKTLREAINKKLDYKLKMSIIGSKITGIDIQGTRIILRTDAKPVKHGDVIYDTSRILVES